MNRLRLCNGLLRDCNRVVYTTDGDVASRVFNNVNNLLIRCLRNLDESSLFVVPTYFTSDKLSKTLSSENVSVSEKKVVSSRINKTRVFGQYQCSEKFRFINGSSFILASTTASRINAIDNVRHFSDVPVPSGALSPMAQSVTLWKSLSESLPVEFAQEALVWLHATTGLPWWATIIVVTWSLRTVVTLPLALYQHYIVGKVVNLKFELKLLSKDLSMKHQILADKHNWTETYSRAVFSRTMSDQWTKLIERDNCHPGKSLIVVLFQIPMWITMSVALRNFCYMLPYRNESAYAIYQELAVGGFGWIADLTQTDPYFVLPVTVGLLNLAIIEMHSMMRTQDVSKFQRFLTNFFRVVSVGLVPVTAYFPSALSLYWASSSAFGVIQNLIVMSPSVRYSLGILPTEHDVDEPYRHLYKTIRQRIGLEGIAIPKKLKKM